MFFFHPTSHHLEACPEAPLMQMGQPTDTLLQRQQTDNLSPARDDGHGLGASHQTGWTGLVANLIDEWRY